MPKSFLRHKKLKPLLNIALMLFFYLNTYSQQKVVTGNVMSEGMPLPGANITIK